MLMLNPKTEMIESFWHEFQSVVAVIELSEYMCDARKWKKSMMRYELGHLYTIYYEQD